jgi:L-fuconolactonase
MLQDEADISWLLDERLVPTFEALEARDLSFDALIRPHQLPTIVQLLERRPRLRLVIDHGAKPAIGAGSWEPWASDIRAAAACPKAFVKLSGLLTEAALGEPRAARQYAKHLVDCFGTERVLWGSDWPMLLLASDYSSWFDMAWDWCPAGHDKIFGGNAAAFYRIGAK